MNKNDYLKELKKHLKHMNKKKKDILNEYDTHFYSGQQEESLNQTCVKIR